MKHLEKKRLLSVVVPYYKKEDSVVDSLLRIRDSLLASGYQFEIIAVVDGFDDQTYTNAKKINSSKIKVLGYKTNKGKGYALRYGMSKSSGDIIGFIDGDRDLDPKGLQMLMLHFDWYDADIIVGSKWHPVSLVKYPLSRVIISRIYSFMLKILFHLSITDTQLGMKFYKRQVLRDVLPRLLVKKFAFDIEILAVAHHLGYTKIYEAPVELSWEGAGSTINKNLITIMMETLWDTLAVFYRLKIIRYYDKAARERKSLYDKELDFMVNTGERTT